MKITELKEGNIIRYQLENNNKMMVEVLNLGGAITKIMVPDKNGDYENVVIAYENLEQYYNTTAFLGCMIGRTAGRIGNATFKINGTQYELEKNNNHNSLHGGVNSFNTKLWDVELIEREDEVGITLSYTSEDKENGYPGTFKVNVDYIVNNNNELTINYRGISDKDTLVNMTNHSYFNLSGDCKRDVLNHDLYIDANNICELDEFSIPSGNLIEVKNTPFDFTESKKIGQDIDKDHIQISYGSGYDHPWVLNKEKETEITLYDPESRRAMDVTTNQKAVVVYSMNFPDEHMKSCGKPCGRRDGICLETQSLPVGYDDCFIEGSILKAGEEYNNTSVYKFYLK